LFEFVQYFSSELLSEFLHHAFDLAVQQMGNQVRVPGVDGRSVQTLTNFENRITSICYPPSYEIVYRVKHQSILEKSPLEMS